jgi:hypothetical protein
MELDNANDDETANEGHMQIPYMLTSQKLKVITTFSHCLNSMV